MDWSKLKPASGVACSDKQVVNVVAAMNELAKAGITWHGIITPRKLSKLLFRCRQEELRKRILSK